MQVGLNYSGESAENAYGGLKRLDFKPFKMGKYLLLERLATGGMAEVYRAKASGASGFEKHLAIKRILPQHLEDETFRRMFETEARIGSSLQHSNIVQILDFVKFGETFLLVMEFVNGKNLRQVINKLKKLSFALPVECALYIINETCKGLEYAHSKKDDFTGQPQNIIHRDMSPQNIMLSYDGSIKIVDFGIANWKDKLEQTKSGVIKGKFGYMSPEQAAGEPVSNLTDLFSTGIIFWELLTGRRLFAAENDLSTLRLIQDCVIPKASQFNSRVTPELERILMKSLSKTVNQRFQTAGAMQKAVQEHLNRHFPSFRESELASMMQGLFKDEIANEKRRIEVLTRQSVPFSQGNTDYVEAIAPAFEIEGSIEEGSITASDQDRVSHVTLVDQEDVPSAVIKMDVSDSKTKETLAPKKNNPQAEPVNTIASTLSQTNPEEEIAAPETIAKTIVAQQPESNVEKSIKIKTEPEKGGGWREYTSQTEIGKIKLDTESTPTPGISRDNWGSITPTNISEGLNEEEIGEARSSGMTKVVAASALIGVTAYLYHMLLSGQSVIPVKVEAQDPRLIGSCDPRKNPNCSARPRRVQQPPANSDTSTPGSLPTAQSINNCELRFETDPPGAIVVIDGVEKLATPGTALVPCDSSVNYSLQLRDHETIAENILVRNKMKPVFKTLAKIERGDLVIFTNRRVRVFSDTDQFGETEPGKPFSIERLPANRSYNLHFVNEIFGIDETRTLEVKPGVSNTYEVRLDEKPEKR